MREKREKADDSRKRKGVKGARKRATCRTRSDRQEGVGTSALSCLFSCEWSWPEPQLRGG